MNLKRNVYMAAAMAMIASSGSGDVYDVSSYEHTARAKSPLTNKQKKARKKNKMAKQSRKKNRR